MISFSQMCVLCTVVSNTSSPVMVFSFFGLTLALQLSDSPHSLTHRSVGSPHRESARRELCDERRERCQVCLYDLPDRGFNVRRPGSGRQNDLCGRDPWAIDGLPDLTAQPDGN